VKTQRVISFIENLTGVPTTSICAHLVALALFVAPSTPVLAVDAVWLSEPGSGDWNTGTNWSTSPIAPVNPGDTATFKTSTQRSLTLSSNVTVESITFQSGASVFSISNAGHALAIQGAGIVNNSGKAQAIYSNFGFSPPFGFGSTQFLNTSTAGNAAINNGGGSTVFSNASTAGNATITNRGGNSKAMFGGFTEFFDSSTAGNATISDNVGFESGGGSTQFFNSSTAGNATISNNGGGFVAGAGSGSTRFSNASTAGNATIANNTGGFTFFFQSSTAGRATIINSIGMSLGGPGGYTFFFNTSTAGNATIISKDGTGSALGGQTLFQDSSDGGTARAITNGNGRFDISGLITVGMKIGSIEGNGNYFLGSKTLTVGGNNLSTTVSGLIQDGGSIAGTGGSLTKVGIGTLTLTGANTYSGGTNLNGGTLAVNSDANLGTGPLSFNGGTLEALATGGGIVSSKAITLNAGGGTFLADSGTTSTLSGAITGTGAWIKTGVGTLILTGANTYSGGTMISAGVLQLGAGGTTGSIVGNVADNGTLVFNRSDSLTHSGVISGTGSVAQIGTGTTILTGNNTYSGATTISAGTLQAGSATALSPNSEFTVNSILDLHGFNSTVGSLSGTGAVLNNGATAAALTAGNDKANSTFSGILENGTSVLALTKSGTGTLVLSGANTYTGGTTISAGTLQIGNGGTTGSITGNVADSGVLVFDRSDSLTFAGAISGMGSVSQIGTGKTILTGNNTYSGGTTINAGTLQIGNGGTTGTIIGNVTDSGTLVFNRIDSVTFGGVISGTGSLVKQGAGTVTLPGANAYTGTTTVNAGSLIVDGSIASAETEVNAGAFLGGRGSLGGNLVNNGIVSPGDSPGTLTVARNYTQNASGTLRIEVASVTEHDLLAVSGHASLAGTLQFISLAGFKLHVGDQLTFLTAKGISGTFDTVQNPFVTGTIVKSQVVYLPDAVVLEGTQGSFVPSACTPNTVAVARALDSTIGDSRASSLIDFLDNEPLNKLCNDFELISPEELASIYNIGVSLANVQTANLNRRMEDIRAGSTGFSSSGFTLNGSTPNFITGFAGVTGPEGKGGTSVMTSTPENRWGVWITGIGEFTNVDSTENAAGYYLQTGGLTLGVDYRVSPNFAIGLTAGYAHTNADLANGGDLDVNSGSLGLYATLFGGGFYIDTSVTGGPSGYSTHRTALLGSANGNTDGGDLNVLVAAGYDWKKGGLTIGPTASFQYTYVGFGGFTESGSLAPLDIHSQNAESERTALGMKASYDWKVGRIVMLPQISLAWQHEFGDQAYSIVASFANGAGNNFTVNSPAIGRDSMLIGAGAAVLLSDRVSIYAYYDGELLRTNYQSNNVSAGVRVTF
jgi:outer membrane autotransporter protein